MASYTVTGIGIPPTQRAVDIFRVSADGTKFGGRSNNFPSSRGFFYSTGTGIILIPLLPGATSNAGSDISGDGATLVGSIADTATSGFTQPYLWTQAGGTTQLLGTIGTGTGGVGTAVSVDASVVVGFAPIVPGSVFHAFKWTSGTGMVALPEISGTQNSAARSVSADGSVIAGEYTDAVGTTRAFKWTAGGGTVEIPGLPGATFSEAGNVSADGLVVTGFSGVGGNNHPWRWTAGDGTVDLGLLPGGTNVTPGGMSADGRVIGGSGDTADGAFQVPCVWTAERGWVQLPLPGTGDEGWVDGVSDDGSVLSGGANITAGAFPGGAIWTATPYAFQTVTIGSGVGNTLTTNDTGLGILASFPCVLYSFWTTAPSDGSFSLVSPMVSGSFATELSLTQLAIFVENTSAGHQIGHATPTISLTPGAMTHVLISVDGPNHRMQAYINDVAVSLTPTWFSTDQISNDAFYAIRYDGGFDQTCIGDFWFSNQDTFTDLSITANRRKFINADLSPADLGANGQFPFSSVPPMFLHCPSGGTADQFVANAGTGGAFSPTLPFGGCGLVGGPYIIQPVKGFWNLFTNHRGGAPASTFRYVLVSCWTQSQVANLAFGSGSVAGGGFNWFSGAPYMNIELATITGAVIINVQWWPGDLPPYTSGNRNFLWSFDTVAQIVQFYIDDVAVPPTVLSWFLSAPVGYDPSTDIILQQVGGASPCMADVYINMPPAFYDLSIVENRRAFIDGSGNPVYLGANGSVPTGTQPQVFFSTAYGLSGGSVADWVVNKGSIPGYFGSPDPPGLCGFDPVLSDVECTGEVGTVSPTVTPRLQVTSLTAGPFPLVKNILWSGINVADAIVSLTGIVASGQTGTLTISTNNNTALTGTAGSGQISASKSLVILPNIGLVAVGQIGSLLTQKSRPQPVMMLGL